MARKRRGNPVHGWIVIDKAAGPSSAQVVARVRRILDAAKAGHAGTLDALATGVLPIALGEATKTVSFVMNGAKAYRFTARWGEARDTDDAEGAVTAASDSRPDRDQIVAVLDGFVGQIDQIPPAFSAIKVDGRRSYELARENRAVELAPRKVRIDRLELIETPDADHAVFEVHCGKGTYVRCLARDMGARLGCLAHVTGIRRLAAGPFDETHAISVEKLETLRHSAPPQAYLLPVETGLDDIPAVELTEAEAEHLKHGRAVKVGGTGGRRLIEDLDDGGVLCAMADGRLVALARLTGDELRPVRVLNL